MQLSSLMYPSIHPFTHASDVVLHPHEPLVTCPLFDVSTTATLDDRATFLDGDQSQAGNIDAHRNRSVAFYVALIAVQSISCLCRAP